MSHSMFRRPAAILMVGVLLSVGALGVIGCAAEEPAPEPIPAPEPAPDPAPEPAPEPDQDGAEAPDTERVLVESKCSGCHDLSRVWAKSTDQAGWEATVARMEAQGLSVTDEERTRIVEYLAQQ